MHEYEIFIEEINPCGGEKYSKKTLIEAEADSPEAYVKEYGRFPVLDLFLHGAWRSEQTILQQVTMRE